MERVRDLSVNAALVRYFSRLNTHSELRSMTTSPGSDGQLSEIVQPHQSRRADGVGFRRGE
jgi:hypothetical protein